MREDMRKHRRHGRWPLVSRRAPRHVPHELQEPARAMRWARHAWIVYTGRTARPLLQES